MFVPHRRLTYRVYTDTDTNGSFRLFFLVLYFFWFDSANIFLSYRSRLLFRIDCVFVSKKDKKYLLACENFQMTYAVM